MLFGRDFWPALARLTGDEGARSVVKANPASCVRVEVPDTGVLLDVDKPDAVHR
ncbi:MobA-like NTP transferase domain protein [compost metagenome]